jgi:hypothetical protein
VENRKQKVEIIEGKAGVGKAESRKRKAKNRNEFK